MNVNGFLTKQVKTPIWRRLKTPTKRIITTLGTILLLITGLNYRMMAQDCVTLPPNQQKSCSISKDGAAVDFMVSGRMPANARMHVESVEREDEEGNPMLAAYDITLTDSHDQEWQPAYGQPAQVTITDPAFGNGRKLDIFHETEEGREYVTTVVSANNTVTFPAKHFSVYVIGTPNGKNRMVVAFVKTRHNDAYSSPDSLLYDTLCMLVKRADTIYNGKFMSRLVYPPNPGYIPDGVNFFGWSRTPDYTADPESRMTIDVVRELVYDRLKNGEEITKDLGDTMMFYSVLLKSHTINYRSLRNPNVVIGVDEVLYLRNDNPEQDYIVNESYIPTAANANFQGWLLIEGDSNVVEGKLQDDIYPNGTSIKIKGDITFMEELAYGYWLVFNENGKGASYTAPKFLKSNDVGIAGDTLSEAEPDYPTRYGYNFGGWYADPTFDTPFVFKGYLNQDTIIHAKWVTKERAFYTIIVWRQNVARNGYDFAESFSLEGKVGYSIASQAIVTGKEGDLDYVIVGGDTLGGIKSVPNGQESDPYTGFTLSTVNPIVDQAVTTDGKAVVNIYFDRMKYKLRLYVVRTNAKGDGDYKGTSIGKSLNPEAPDFLGNWSSGNIVSLSGFPQLFGSNPHFYDVSGSYRYYYDTITAYYGENIRNRWPTHEKITVSGSNYFISWFLMSGAKAFVPGANGTGNGTGGNTLKGEVNIMDEQILGRLDDSTANLLLARYATTFCPTTFYYYFHDVNGNPPDEPSDTVITRAGENNYTYLMDKGPSFEGYTYDKNASDGLNYKYHGQNKDSAYVLNYHYRRKAYSITFRDGVYLDGNGDELQNNSSNTPLRIMTGVKYGANIDTLNSYEPTLPLTEEGFVFDGWYMDDACSRRYEFDKMPMGNLVVYARWRQIQYRVFLHPQAGKDPSLNWGNASQAMNFRISYGGKVSAPTGQRDLYEFGGWYLDSTYQNRYFAEVSTLTEQTVTTPYVKNVDMTDNMDKWGVVHNPDTFPYVAYNSDTIVINNNGDIISNKDTVDRFWITKKLDLYARWRHKLDGAEGVKVQYFCDSCEASSMPRPDTNLYLDKSKMVAAPAATSAFHNKIFAYWVLQNWNPTKGRFVDSLDANGKPVFVYPGGPYTLHLPYTWRKQTGDSAVYVYQLRAELESYKDNHTFIVWYRNWGKPDGDTVRYDPPDTLTINMMVTIPYPNEVGEREGYIYKGWHKEGYGPEGSGQESTFEARLLGDTTTVNSLWYNPEDGQYYSKDYTTLAPDSLEFYRAYGVGADEVTPYDYFYAVWEPIQYTIRFHQNTDDPIVTGTMEDQVFKYDERKNLSKIGYLYKCHKFLGWAMSPDGEVVYENQEEILNLTSENGKIFDLYAKWVEESHNLVVSPDSATCLSPGSIGIRLDGVSMPNYTYSVIELDTTDTPYGTADTVWQHVSSGTHIVAHHIVHGLYRVEVVTGSQCVVYKDTAVFLNPVEVPWDNPIETVCSGSPFVIKPSTNDDVRYLWDAPTKSPGAVVIPDTANNNDPQEYILCTISNNDGSPVSYTIHAILGNCELGDVPTTINVSSAELGPFTINLSSLTDTLCSGTSLDVTASVNENIYNKDSYKLNWIFKGDTISSTETGHSPTVIQQLTMPDTCRGDFSVEVYYADVTECHVNAVKNFKVRIKDWEGPERKDSTVHCVKAAVAPHTIEPSIMPVVKDGCGDTLKPIIYDTLVVPVDLSCDGTVTYIYEYEDCDGKEKYWDFVYHVDKQAPEIAITSIPDPTPIGACQYRIPAIGYELTDCDPSLVTVTQTPSATDHIRQIDKDSVVTITLTAADKCGDTATVITTVTIPARPTVTPTAEKPEFCLGDTTRVTAATTGTSSASVITWSATPSTGEFTYGTDTTFTTTTHDPYTLTATVVENGCLATGETSVTVKPSAELTVTNQNQTTCFGASISNVYITLLYTDNLVTSGDLPAGVTFHSENNGYVISGTPTQAGVFKYYLTASSQDPSCGVTKDSVSIEISPFTEGTVSISGDTVFCEGKSTTLRVKQNAQSNAKSYTWANSNGILPYTKSYLTVVEPGTYSVTVTSLEGCISTGSQIVTRNPRPSVELVLPSPICPEDNVQQLQANITDEIQKPEYTYYWTTGKDAAFNGTEHLATPTLTMLVPENCKTISYPVTLILEDSSGCQKTVSDSILMRNVPPTITRKTESITLSPNAYCQYFIPNQQALDTLVDISGNCTRTEDLSTSIFYPSANDGNIITSTDSITITVTDACNHSARTKIEVKIPEGMPVQERDSLVLNSFEWEGITYTESTTVESEDNNIGHSCSIDRANITVLHTNKTDTAICKGVTANLIVKMEQPVRPAVGDVLCLKPTSTTNVYDTLVLRPDTFLARATDEELTPIGVVFYVDPNDDRKGKALALVDAYSEACVWADNNSFNDGNTLNNSIYKAAYDTDGFTNTIKILSSANNNNDASAPAAYNCYHYDPLTQTTATSNKGWYLPAAGEVSMWFAQRLVINKTLKSLTTYLNSNNSSLISEIPFDNDNSTEKGYWTSTDFDGSNADHVSQEGEIIKTSKTSVDKARNVRAVCSFDLSTNNASAQVAVPHNIGDIITFRDGSQGVVCYINPDNPYSGWAVALQDLNNPNNEKNSGKVMLLPAMDRNKYPSVAKNDTVTWITWPTADTYVAPNGYTGYGRTEWESQPGYANGMVNTGKLLRVNNSPLATLNIDTSNYWYIPDMMQLRQWYALFPVIKDVDGLKLPNANWGDEFYWSSTGTKQLADFGCLWIPKGYLQSKRGTNSSNQGHIRLVRDFDLSISWDNNNAVASANPLADTMKVRPDTTQTYYATVKFCGWTLRDSATVIVATKPKITAKNDTADRLLGCNPASIPIMTVDSFTVEDNSKPDAKVTLTHRDTSGIECSLTWMATYQNQCGQKADTVRVTYRWTQLSVKAKDSTKVFDGEALQASYSYTPTDIEANPTFQYKVKTGDTWGDYTTTPPSITHAGSLTYLVETTVGSCNCTVSDTATLTITKRPVKFTATSEEKSYTGSEITINNLTVNSGENEGLVNGHTHNVTFSASGTEVGEHPGTITAANAAVIMSGSDTVTANYDVSVENGKLTITKTSENFTISLANDEYEYDATAHHNTNTASSTAISGTTTYSYSFEESGTYVSDLSSLTKTDAGEYTIYVKGTNPNYENTATTTSLLTITPKLVTVTAKSDAFTYNGTAQSNNGFDVDGLVGDDAISAVVTGTITFPSQSPVTNELASYEFTHGTPGNYNVTTANGELTMTKASKAITITAASDSKTYDGSALTNSNVSLTSGSLLPGDELVAEATGSVTNVSETTTGNNPIAAGYKVMHGEEDVTANYAITAVDGTLTINKKIVTVSVEDKSVEYNGGEQNGNTQCTFSNLLTGHTATITYTPSHGTLVGEHTNGAFTPENFSVVDANNNVVTGNYTLETMTSGKLTITDRTEKYAITVVAKSSSGHVYDGTEKSVAGFETTSFNVGGHTYTVSGLTTSDPHRTNAGSSTNAISGTAVVKDAANNDVTNQFNVTTQNGTLEIAARVVTVSVADRSVEYNGSEQYGNTEYTFTNVVEGQTATITYTPSHGMLASTTAYDNGSYGTDFSVVDANNSVVTDNYTLETKTSGKLTITQNTTTLYVESKGKSWDYTGNPHTNHEYVVHFGDAAINAMAEETTGTYTATLGTGDVVTITPASSAKVTHVSEGEVSNTFTWTMMNESYYTKGTDVVGKLKVNPAALTVTTNTAIRQYNGQPLTADGSISGLVTPTGGVQETVTFTVTGTITKVGGPIENSYSLVWNGTAAESDYTVSEALGTLTISQNSAEIKVTPGSGEKIYDGTPLTKTAHDDFTVTGLPEGFTWTATADGTVTNVTPGEGEKAVNAVTDFHIFKGSADVTDQFSSINTTATGTLEITPRAVTLTSGSKTRQYNGTALTNAEVEGKNLYGLIVESGWVGSEGATYSFTGSQMTEGQSFNTFTYTLKSGTSASNYTITKTEGLLEITKNTSAVDISSSSKSWTYDGNNHTDEVYMVKYGGASVTNIDATGKVFTLPTGDKVTITPTAAGVTQHADNASNNNTFTYILENESQYQTVTHNVGTLSIDRKAVTISALPQTYTYTGTAQGPEGTHTDNISTYAEYDELATGDVLWDITLSGSQLNAGTYITDIEPSSAVIKRGDNIVTDNYNITYTKADLTINRAEITLTCPSGTAITKVYDGNELHPSATATGVNSSDMITIEYSTDNGTTWSTSVPGIMDVGTQPVSVRATHSNYITANCDYMLIVSANSSSVVITSSTKSWTYDGGTHKDEVYTVIYGGATVAPDDATGGKVFTLPTTDKLTITSTAEGVTYYSNNYANNNTYTYVLENAGNYTSVIANVGTLSIKRKDLTIAPIPKAYTYNGTVQGPANTYTNGFGTYVTWSELATGDELSSITLAGSRLNAGTYANDIVSSNAEIKRGNVDVTGNYNITYAYANLTIHPATISLICPNVTDITKPFDGSELHPSATATGVLSSDVMNIEYSTDNGTTWSTSVPGITYFGTKPVLVRATNSNYHIAECGYTLSITRNTSTINVTPGSGEKTYDGTPLTKTTHDDFTVTGVPVGFTWTATADGTVTNVTPGASEKAENAVTDFHIFNADIEDVTNQFSNINTTAKGTLTITARPITLKANNASNEYTGSAITYATAGDAVSPYYTLSSGSLVVGHNITAVTLTGSGTTAGSYDITITEGGVTVKDGSGNNVTANYTIARQPGTLTISQNSAAIVVVPGSGSKTYDGTPLTKMAHDDFTVTGLPDGFTWTATAGGTVTNVTPGAGEKAVNAVTSFKIYKDNTDVTDQFSNITKSATGTLTISSRPITLKANNASNEYTGSAITYATAGNAVSPYYTIMNTTTDGEGLASGHSITAIALTGSGTTTGSYDITITEGSVAIGGNTANYAITLQKGTLTIGQNSATITVVPGSGSKTYDGSPLTKTEHEDFTVTGVPDGFTWSATADGTVTNVTPGAGEKAVNAVTEFHIFKDGTDVTNQFSHITKSATGTLTINRRPVTVTAKSEEFIYDGTAHNNPGYDVDGLVGSDAINAVVSGSITFPNQSPVTNALANYQFTSGTPGNYNVTTANGQLTMKKAEVAITITAASQAWTYDGNAHSNSTVSVTSGALLSGDQLVATASGSVTNVSETADSNNIVNEGYKIMHNTQDVTENYVITPVKGKLTINPKEATVKALDMAFVYTGTAQSWPHYNVSGLVGSDAIIATITSNITFPSQSPVPNVVESYSFTTGTDSNYTVSLVPGQLTMVNAAVPITITAASQEWTYDGAAHSNPAVSVTSGSLLPGDSLVANATGSVTNVSGTAVGNTIAPGYKVMHGTEDVSANYVISTQAGKLTIKPKAVTVTANSDAFTYDGTAHSNNGYVVNGLVGSDAISAVVTGSITFPSQSPATNTLTSYQFTAGTPGNYSVTKTNGQLTMTPANVPITITAASDSKTYDGTALTNATVTVTSGSLLPGDSLVANANGSVTNVDDVTTGNNTIAPNYKIMHGTQDVTANYVIDTVAGTLTITPRTVTVSVANKTVEYNGAVQNGNTTCTFGNVVAGQTATIGYTAANGLLPSETPYDNSSYADNFTVMAGTTDVTSNYILSTRTPGNLTIRNRTQKFPITVQSNSSYGNVYDGSVKSASGFQTLSFTFNNNTFTVSGLTTSDPSHSEVCDLPNAISGTAKVTDAHNHDVTEQFNVSKLEGRLTIQKRPVTVSVDDKTVDYNGSLQYGHTASTFNNVVSGQTATIGYTASSGIMVSTVPYDNGNYGSNFQVMSGETNDVTSNYTLTLMKKGKLKIDPAPLIVTAKDSTKIYDGLALHASYTYESNESQPTIRYKVKNGDTWSGYTTDLPSITNAGSLTYLVEASIATYTTTDTATYTTSDTATLTVTKRDVTVTVADTLNIEYTGSEHHSDKEPVFHNVVAGQTPHITYHPAHGIVVGEYVGNYVTESFKVTRGATDVTANYNLTTMTPGRLTIVNRSEKYTLNVVAKSDTNNIYDGITHYAIGYDTVVHLNDHHFTVTGLTTSNPSSKNVCEMTNTLSGTPVVKDNHGNDVTNQFNVNLVNGLLKIKPRPITLRSNPGLRQYDSIALVRNTQNDVIVEGSGFVQNEGATYHITGSQREVGMSYNVFTYTLNQGTLAQNYKIDTVYGTLTVTPDSSALHIESRSEDFVYNAQPHRRDEYRVVYKNVARDPVPGTNGLKFALPTKDTLTITPTFNGITHISENADSNNTFTYTLQHSDWFAGKRDTVYGTVKIRPRAMSVHINGHAGVKQYNGQQQSVTGFDIHFLDTLYSASYIKYNGDSIATRKDSGRTMMNLQAAHFVNQNNDFSPVTFNITDGEILIIPDTGAAVILVGRHSMVDYDGLPHSVHGYEIVSISSNYSASFFEFTGTVEDSTTTTRIDAGFEWMGLSDTMFRNTNPNFHDVTFILQSDGYQQIKSIKATVKVTGHADTREYDGAEHTVTGYDLEISPSLYTANDFTFSGQDTAKRTEGGTSWMGLADSQFVNTNPNFNQVTFTITDGKQVIKPNSTALTLNCPGNLSKPYDGTPLSAAAMASSTITGDEFVIKYKSKFEGESVFSDWYDTVPSITNYGVKFVEVSCSNPNYLPKSCTYTLSILKRDVHLTSMDSTRIYNGDTLRYDSVKVTGNGFVNGEGATFTVTGSQLLPGSTPNVFDYTLNPGTLADNYIITKSYGTLHVDERPDSLRYPITVVSNSNPVATGLPIFYDGLKHTASDFVTLTFTTEDGHPYTVTGLTANVSGFDAGTYPNTIHGNPTVLDEHGHDVTDQFYTELVKGNLVIRKRPVTITVPSEHATMMYNGDSLRVYYENIDISTLADRDTLKSGYVISEGYTIGTYHCNDNMFMATTGVASQHDFNIVHGATEEYAAGNSMANYRPRFDVTLTITKRPLEITASSAEKVYDGNPLTLTESDYTLTGGTSIAPSDTLIITRSGAQTCVGESANHITSVTILHKDDGVDVTYCYNISTVDGLIKVTAANTGLISPETLNITLGEGTYDTLVPQSLLGMPSHDLLDAGVASVSNDLDEHNPLTVGTHTIKWILYDTCHTAMDSCYQTVVVNISPCEGVTYHGHFYDAKRIGQQCWMTENLRNEIDAAGNPIANYHTFMDDTNNLHKFGYLYTWNSAVGVPENSTAAPQTFTGDDGQPFVQGICPAGWAVPTEADYSELQLFVGDAMLLKDAGEGYWVPGNGGTLPNSGFNARGGGFFNSAANRYEGILSDYWAWTSDFNAGGVTATSANISYYCNAMTFVEANKTDRRSVRCVRKVYDGQ